MLLSCLLIIMQLTENAKKCVYIKRLLFQMLITPRCTRRWYLQLQYTRKAHGYCLPTPSYPRRVYFLLYSLDSSYAGSGKWRAKKMFVHLFFNLVYMCMFSVRTCACAYHILCTRECACMRMWTCVCVWVSNIRLVISYWYGQLVGHKPLVVYLCVHPCVYPCVRRGHVAILLSAWLMADYETVRVCRVPYCQQCIKCWWWPSDPIKFEKRFNNLICHFVCAVLDIMRKLN